MTGKASRIFDKAPGEPGDEFTFRPAVGFGAGANPLTYAEIERLS